ncbi:response regulator transcription factor [Polyangium aurulentum]|uniref:response regulator transcription factor n=1 Tax=Polyangium aurulentum TaxID=2567896 RepID=UPI0010AEB8DD|nr:response regulator [Polyangium aurulentum]UQA62156.1 response regulator [Polyangium aurulentum]
MASTILAVDDSVTMRKVLEITFAGPEFRCVTVNGPDAALEKLKTEKPAVVIADVTLEGRNGYELCKAIKQASPTTPVLILSSKQNPYDAAKGSAAQADDHMDKPYDTQQMIDKVKKLLSAPAQAPKAAAAAAPAVAPAAAAAGQQVQPVKTPVAAAGASAPTAAAPQRAKTLLYNPGQNAPTAAPAKPEPAAAKPVATPTPAGGIPMQPKAAPGVSPAAAAAINGQMTARLEELGLNAQQIEGVLALSRDVIERVVWEVVPVMAETIIREEIARLTK